MGVVNLNTTPIFAKTMAISPREKYLSSALYIVLIVLLWLFFSPAQLGGKTSYVIITGNSMEPNTKVGDLVVTRAESSYTINQRVVFNDPNIGPVFHRIIGQEKELFTLKGDNNSWTDSFHPTQSDIIGRYWFTIPGAGTLIQSLRKPIYFTSFALIIFLIIGSLLFFQNKDNIQKKRIRKKTKMDNQNPKRAGDTRQELLFFLVFLLITALILAGIAYSRPLMKTIADDVSYKHIGEFDYFAPDTAGIYDSATIETGDPIYTKLNCIVDTELRYQLSSNRFDPARGDVLKGTYRVIIKLSDIDGWNRSFLLIPKTDFEGNTFEDRTLLDICYLQALITDKEEKTETLNPVYFLSVYPDIRIDGTIDGHIFSDIYQPEISFQIDSNMMRLPDGEESLDLNVEGTITNEMKIRNYLRIFGRMFDIEAVRQLSVIIALLTVIGAFFPARSLFLEYRESNPSRIKLMHQALLIDVKKGSLKTKSTHVIEVASFQDLVNMAERYGTMILHESRGMTHHYSIQDEGTLYRYSLTEKKSSGEEV